VILDIEQVLSRRDDARKGERGTPERFVEAHPRVRPAIEGGMVEGEVHRIQGNGRTGRNDIDGDRDLAGEGERPGIRDQCEVVVNRDDAIRQDLPADMRRGRRCSRVRCAHQTQRAKSNGSLDEGHASPPESDEHTAGGRAAEKRPLWKR